MIILQRRILAILGRRCPVCLGGAMFFGLTTMRDSCLECGHRFMREEGFFQGAMYISYSAAVVEFALFAWIAYVVLGPRIGVRWAFACALLAHLILVPVLFGYSRVLWAHLNVATGARRGS